VVMYEMGHVRDDPLHSNCRALKFFFVITVQTSPLTFEQIRNASHTTLHSITFFPPATNIILPRPSYDLPLFPSRTLLAFVLGNSLGWVNANGMLLLLLLLVCSGNRPTRC
jgi:hypothetical protein